VHGPGIVQINTWSNRICSALAFVWLFHAKVLGGSSLSNGISYKDPCLRTFPPAANTPTVHMDIPKEFNPFRRRWSSNPSGKCSYERPTRGTVCGTMRSMCGADAGYLAINYQISQPLPALLTWYRGTSLERNRPPLRTTTGPQIVPLQIHRKGGFLLGEVLLYVIRVSGARPLLFSQHDSEVLCGEAVSMAKSNAALQCFPVDRARANMAHTRPSRPSSGLGSNQ
jgi:hypothetical protein